MLQILVQLGLFLTIKLRGVELIPDCDFSPVWPSFVGSAGVDVKLNSCSSMKGEKNPTNDFLYALQLSGIHPRNTLQSAK